MHLQITSDLHVNHKNNLKYCCEHLIAHAETLVIAGDFCVLSSKHRRSFISFLLGRYHRVICIPGNHDFYNESVKHPYFSYADEVIEENGGTFYYLNNAHLDIGDIRFICTCLWSPVIEHSVYVYNGVNDYHEIRDFDIDFCNMLYKDSRAFLYESLEDLPVDKRAVVVTHHLPSWNFISSRYRGSLLNEAFASNLDDLLYQYSDVCPLWVYGHSHDSYAYTINGMLCVRNPVGYVSLGQSKNFDKKMTIEV